MWMWREANCQMSAPRRSSSRLMALLLAAARDRVDLQVGTFDEAEVRWALETGLGPLLCRCASADPRAAAAPLWPLVRGADLTARMFAAEQMDAMSDLIDACRGRIPPVTLLKGISICEQHYPEPHLRPMRDIDFWVEPEAIPVVEALLRERGYRPEPDPPPAYYDTHHHVVPFVHARAGIWVEVHRGLFPPESEVGSDRVFGLENLRTELRPSEFRGQRVTRLSDELQIVYLAVHWAREQAERVVGGMVAMLDMIYLLKRTPAIDWARILEWLDGAVAARHLYLLLSYLDRRGLIALAPDVSEKLRRRQRSFGPVTLRMMHALIDRHLVDGCDGALLTSTRTFKVLWRTFLLPGPPSRNLLLVPWNLVPGRFRPRWTRKRPGPF
jgi:Uncharacterised nucleotidyltransferase